MQPGLVDTAAGNRKRVRERKEKLHLEGRAPHSSVEPRDGLGFGQELRRSTK